MDGYKTYTVAALFVLFGVGIAVNDVVQFGYVQADSIRYIGSTILGGAGLASLRHGVAKGG